MSEGLAGKARCHRRALHEEWRAATVDCLTSSRKMDTMELKSRCMRQAD